MTDEEGGEAAMARAREKSLEGRRALGVCTADVSKGKERPSGRKRFPAEERRSTTPMPMRDQLGLGVRVRVRVRVRGLGLGLEG